MATGWQLFSRIAQLVVEPFLNPRILYSHFPIVLFVVVNVVKCDDFLVHWLILPQPFVVIPRVCTETDQKSAEENGLGVMLTTITISESPNPRLTSTSTGYASMPLAAAEQTLANMS
jgi:hypothetical protein